MFQNEKFEIRLTVGEPSIIIIFFHWLLGTSLGAMVQSKDYETVKEVYLCVAPII